MDIIIRNGTIIDGTGLPGYVGDVGIDAGRIVSVGRPLAGVDAARVIDATGHVVAPGFVDPHTHLGAQLLFDPYCYPTVEHGVTTVVTGNCSLSIAPVRAAHRDRFSRMFRLIEEMPAEAFDNGVDWRWGEDFAGLLDTVAQDLALNVAPLVGHSVRDRCRRAGGRCRRPGLATGADAADRHQLDARPAQHHVPRHPRLVAGAVAAVEAGEAGGADQPGDASDADSRGSARSPRREDRRCASRASSSARWRSRRTGTWSGAPSLTWPPSGAPRPPRR